MESIKALRGFRDVYGEEIERFSLIESVLARYFLGLLGYREIEIPSPGKDRAFQKEHRGHHRHRREGDVHLHRQERRFGNPAARGHGGRGARLPAGLLLREGEGEQALHHGPHVPPRETAEGQVQAVLPRWTWRSSA